MSWRATRRRSADEPGAERLTAGPGTARHDDEQADQVVYVSIPILDGQGAIIDLRIADVGDEHRSDSQAYRSAVGRLGSTVFSDPGKMLVAATAAWQEGNATPFVTQRRFDYSVGSAVSDCEVSTMRLGDRIIQICRDRSDEQVVAPSESVLASVIDAAELGVILLRPRLVEREIHHLEMVWHNDAARRIWGSGMSKIVSTNLEGGHEPLLIDLARTAWRAGTVNRLRHLPEVPGRPATTVSQTVQRVGDHLLEIAIDLTDETQMTEALQRMETRFGETLDTVTDAIVVVHPIYDDDGVVVDALVTYANAAAWQIFDIAGPTTVDAGVSLTGLGLDVGDFTLRSIAAAARGERIEELVGQTTQHDHPRFAGFSLGHVTFTPMADHDVLIVVRDLSQLHHARDQFQRAVAFDEMIVDALADPAAVFHAGEDGEPIVVAVNRAGAGWLPHPPPCALRDLPYPPDELDVLEAGVRAAIEDAKPSRSTIVTREDVALAHDVLAVRLVHSPMAGDRSLLVVHDVSHEVNESLRYRRQARHDPETGLLNGIGFRETVEELLQRDPPTAVVTLELDHVQLVENVLGPTATQLVLDGIVDRVRRVAAPGTVVARLRSTTIALALPGDLPHSGVVETTLAVVSAINRSLTIEDRQIHVGSRAGVAFVEATGYASTDAHLTIQRSQSAATNAQRHGRDIVVWDATIGIDEPRLVELLGEIEQAMDDDQFFMVFQPQVDGDGGFIGAEALVRWRHPVHGLLGPVEFIELVEASTLALAFTSYVLRASLADYRRTGLPGTCTINVPAGLLADPGLVAVVRDAMDHAGVGADVLTLEVTEPDLTPVVEHVADTVAQLHDLGVRLSVDGFSIGTASLRYLDGLSVDVVNVGRSIIAGIDDDPAKQRTVEAMVEIAALANARVVAIGVETQAEIDTCVALGVHAMQGYALGAPALLDEWAGRYGEAHS